MKRATSVPTSPINLSSFIKEKTGLELEINFKGNLMAGI